VRGTSRRKKNKGGVFPLARENDEASKGRKKSKGQAKERSTKLRKKRGFPAKAYMGLTDRDRKKALLCLWGQVS